MTFHELLNDTARGLEPELLGAVGDERDVDHERAREVADDETDRAPVEDGDEDHHRRDGDQDVGDAGQRI